MAGSCVTLQRNEDVNMAAVSEAVVDNKEAVLDSRISDALSYLRGKEIDTNFDYSTEEAIQARQVGQRFERAQALQSLGNQVIDEVQAEGVLAKPVQAAQDFLTTRRENLAAKGGVGPARVEQQLASDVVGKTGFGARAMSDVATPSNLKKYESVSNLGPDAVVRKQLVVRVSVDAVEVLMNRMLLIVNVLVHLNSRMSLFQLRVNRLNKV